MKPPVPYILDHAVAVAGGKKRLAAEMQVTPAAVTHWFTRGLPQSVAAELMRRYSRRTKPTDWKPKEQR